MDGNEQDRQGRVQSLVSDMTGPVRRLPSEGGAAESLFIELRDNSMAIASFNSELRNARESLALISRIVKDGNGQPALVTRMSVLEKTVNDLVVIVNRLEAQQRDLVKEDKADIRETKGQRLKFYGMITPAILAMIVSILTLIIK
jgi:hypothetical protein